MDFTRACGNRGNLRVPLQLGNFYFLAPLHTPFAQVRSMRSRIPEATSAARAGTAGTSECAPQLGILFFYLLCTPRSQRSEKRFGQSRSDFTGLLREPREPQSAPRSSEILFFAPRVQDKLFSRSRDRIRRASDLFQIPPGRVAEGETQVTV